MNAVLHDALSGLLQVKIFNQEKEQERRFHESADRYRQSQLETMFTWAYFSPSMNFLGSLGSLLVLLVGGMQVIRGEASVGDIMAFMLYLNLFYEPVGRLHALNNLWQDARPLASGCLRSWTARPKSRSPRTPSACPVPCEGK